MAKDSSKLFKKYIKLWSVMDNSLDTLYSYIKDYNISVDNYCNITVTNTDDKDIPVFCCHLDTVHDAAPSPVLVKNDILFSCNSTGIGGDDKCGIVACIELLKRLPCKVIFFRDEEVGCKGAKQYNQDSLKDNRFMIEIDRKGNSDLIYKYSGTEMCSEDFIADVDKIAEQYEYKPANGLYTDVSHLDGAGISRMNISAGYYMPHTEKEYVVLSELQKTIDLCYDIGKQLVKQYPYEKKKKIEVLYSDELGWYTVKDDTELPWYKQVEDETKKEENK